MTIKHSLSSLLSILLIIGLIAPSVSLAMEDGPSSSGPTDAASGGSGREASQNAGSGSGSEAGDAAEAAEAEAQAEADRETAERAADGVRDAANVADVSDTVSVDPVDPTTDPTGTPGGSVSVNGQTMSVEAAISAIGAIADARAQGLNVSYSSNQPGVDVGATLSAHAMGDTGVVGMMSSEFGTPAEVSRAEREHAGRASAVDSAMDPTDSVSPRGSLPDALSAALSALNREFGVPAATAAPTGMNVTVTPTGNYIAPSGTTQQQMDAYRADMAQYADAHRAATTDWNNAYDRNDVAAMERAEAAIDAAVAGAHRTAEAHFGPDAAGATNVSFEGNGGDTVGDNRGGTENAEGTTGNPDGSDTGTGTAGNTRGNDSGGGNEEVGIGGDNTGTGRGTGSGTGTGRGTYNGSTGDFTRDDGTTVNTETGEQKSDRGNNGDETTTTGQESSDRGSDNPSLNNNNNGLAPNGTGGYEVETLEVRITTPETDLVTGNTDVGGVPNELQDAAKARGYNLDDSDDVLAVGYAYEIDAKTRAKIEEACGGSGDCSTLDNASIEEVAAILGAIAGEASRTNRTIATQIAYPKYLTSVTGNGKAFDVLRSTRTREALSKLAGKLTDGTLSRERGLGVTAPVQGGSNHFYADLLPKYNPPNWASKLTNPTSVGQYNKSVVGYIPTEIDPAYEGARAAAERSPNLMSPNPMAGNAPSFTVTVKEPPQSLWPADLQNLPLSTANSYAPTSNTTPAAAAIEAALTEDSRITKDSTDAEIQSFWSQRNADAKASLAMVNPSLVKATALGTQTFEARNPQYEVVVQGPASGFRGSGSTGNHGKQADGLGGALDIAIYNRETGDRLTNFTGSRYRGSIPLSESMPVYQEWFNEVVIAGYDMSPQFARSLRHGGYFSSSAAADSMHIDVRAHRGTGGGSTLGGFTDEHMERFGITSNNPLGSWDNVAALANERYNNPASVADVETTPAQVTQASMPAQTTEPTPATNVESPAPTTTRTPSTVDRVTENVTRGIQGALAQAGIPADNPIVEALVPAVVTIAVNGMIPTPARLALEIIDRNKSLSGLFETDGSTTPQTTPTREGEDRCNEEEDNTTCPTSDQGAMAWVSVTENNLFVSLLEKLWPIPQSSDNTNKGAQVDTVTVTKIPVTITVNAQTGDIELSREDIFETLEAYQAGDEIEDDAVLALYEQYSEHPIVFDDDGEVVYSNGLYAPVYKDGYEVYDPTIEYVYIIKQIDQYGEVIEPIANDDTLPENFLSKGLKKIFTNSSDFYFADVEVVTYRLVDPDTSVPRDEYYDYAVTLRNGEVRAITIPEYSSISFMKERFALIGYQGEVVDLIGLAYETFEKPTSLFGQAVALMKNYVEDFLDTEETTDTTDTVTVLPLVESGITADDVYSIFIYPEADINCPVIDGSSTGFAYNVTIKDNDTPDQVTMISDARCGEGDAEALVEETARHVSEKYGITDLTYSTAVEKTIFRFEEIFHTSGVFTAYTGDNSTPTTKIPDEPDQSSPTEPVSTSTASTPNLTNEVVFEVKAVGNDGTILSNWSTAESITISAGAQLYFRWDGAAYQQCLPFLNDNGNYSLTRANRAMTTGNTETEQYNVTERTGVYKIECGGQRNNEFGVDYREVEVRVQ